MAAVMASHPTPTVYRPLNALPSPPPPRSVAVSSGRRHCLFLLTAATALKPIYLPSSATAAEPIPLFGLRKKIQKVEEVAEEVVKEGIQAAEKELETVEKEIEAETTSVLSVDAAVQAGAVAGAELLGVVVATSIVNGILAPQK